MKELKLTDEQVEKAAQAMLQAEKKVGNWPYLSLDRRIAILRASALYLQFPPAEPTEEELDKAEEDWAEYHGTARQSFVHAFNQFFARRNAPPKVDKRIESIVKILSKRMEPRERAQAILSALDEAGK